MDVYILSAKRTPIGEFGGSLKDISAPRLAAIAIKSALEQSGVNIQDIDETIVGNILMAGQGMGPGRQASIYAGIPDKVPAYTVNMLCASGMKAIMLGATEIALGKSDLIVAAGMENMSQAPYLLPYRSRFGLKFGDIKLEDCMIKDGLTDVFNQVHMGMTAEVLAEEYKISRQEQDKFAYQSQMKAKAAVEEGRFKDEIVPVEIKGKKEVKLFNTDEHPRFDVTLETLAKLRPVFKKEGTITAGNTSGINDGASAVILGSERYIKENNLKPLAKVVAWAQTAVEPMKMGIGPVSATEKVLNEAKLNMKDVELIELNEAFAAQSLAVYKGWQEKFGIDKEWLDERVNVNGGAIAFGHPIGCSGNRIVVTLLYEMKKRDLDIGLATLCVGGGMGTAVILKNVRS